ncbi:MAG: N-acetylmuramoyl-L-alanine amidase [Clostridiales bacterium]|nr:N-acetylmuramoyl-L-alanine amidase [Clostridiales bacterium]
MRICKHKVDMKRLLLGFLIAVISGVLILTTISAANLSAYYTQGALGRSLDVYANFSVNRNYLAPAGTLCRSTQMLGEFVGVTIHETSNWRAGANARMHAMYLRGGGQNEEVSWHYSVDSVCAYQSIPESEKAWHAGDTGKGTGNAHTIAIEICDYSDDGNFDQAMANAEWLAADILYRHGVYTTEGSLFQHNDFSLEKKNCPITIRDTNRWDEFCIKTQMFLDRMVAAQGTIRLDDSDCNFSFSGSLPEGFGASRVDIYSKDSTLVGSVPVTNNSFAVLFLASQFKAGWHSLSFAAVKSDGTSSWKSFSFLVGPASRMSLDLPSGKGTVYEDITVQGWAICHAGISRIDVYDEDNSLLASTDQLYERSDIDAIFNTAGNYLDALHSGFSCTIASGALSAGLHVIRVEATGYDGSVQSISREISVGEILPDYPDSLSDTEISVNYQSHIQDIGWQGWVSDSSVSGTIGQAKQLEGIRVFLNNIDGGVEYRTHVQDIGWMDWVSDGYASGTSGLSKQLEAVEIRLTGEAAEDYDIYYRVHAQNIGWMGWAKNGVAAGTAGYSYRLEAIEIQLVLKDAAPPGSTANPFVELFAPKTIDNVSYKTHVQDIGWQDYVRNGDVSGTSGQSKRLEAIEIKLENIVGGIEYRTHVQDIGWMDYVADGALSGTSGQSKRLEAIQIHLTGAAAETYDIYYCVHAQNVGWLDWAKNGESAGTAGFSYRLEAIKIVLVPKGGAAPGPTTRAFVQG